MRIEFDSNQVSFLRYLVSKHVRDTQQDVERTDLDDYWEKTTDERHRFQRLEEVKKILDEADDGTCPSCHASLNNLDPDDHSCKRDYEPDDRDGGTHLRQELGRTDARTQIWQ